MIDGRKLPRAGRKERRPRIDFDGEVYAVSLVRVRPLGARKAWRRFSRVPLGCAASGRRRDIIRIWAHVVIG